MRPEQVSGRKSSKETSEQETIEEARLFLAAIVEGSDDAIISKDFNGIITSWNKGAEKMFGYTAKEAIGRSITILIPPNRHSEEETILSRLRRGERLEHFETVRVRKDGRMLDISLTVSPVMNSEGKVIGASKIARDITERKRVEAALQEAQAQLRSHARELEAKVDERTARLRALVDEMETFSYSVSHDLRAPLRAMQQYSMVLLEDYGGKLDAMARGYLENIVRSGRRLDTLIRDVLAYSRILRAEMPLQRVELGELVAEILTHYPVLRPPQAEVEIKVPLAPVRGNETLLTQCISNLLVNAVKFVRPDRSPHVRIWTERRGDQVRLWVQDNGVGIAPENHARIFKMFERVHGEKEYEGTGIGLAVVQKAVERMGGTVGVESEVGQGARFWLELPAA